MVKQLIRLSSLNKIHLYGPNQGRHSTDSLAEDLEGQLPIVQSISSSESYEKSLEPTPRDQVNQNNTPKLKASFAEFSSSGRVSQPREKAKQRPSLTMLGQLPKSITPQIKESQRNMSVFSMASAGSVRSKVSQTQGKPTRKTMEQARSPGPRSNSISIQSKGPLELGPRMQQTEMYKPQSNENFFKFLNVPKNKQARNHYLHQEKTEETVVKAEVDHPFTIEPLEVPENTGDAALRQSDKLAGRRQLEITLSHQELEEQRPSKESLRTVERDLQKNSNHHHFESPKGDFPMSASLPLRAPEHGLPKSGSGADSIGTKQLNPIESPDVIGR